MAGGTRRKAGAKAPRRWGAGCVVVEGAWEEEDGEGGVQTHTRARAHTHTPPPPPPPPLSPGGAPALGVDRGLEAERQFDHYLTTKTI